MDGHYIAQSDWPDFSALLRAWRGGELTRPPPGGEGGRTGHGVSKLVVLESDLLPGGETTAEELRRETRFQVVDVAIVGFPELFDPQGPGFANVRVGFRWESAPFVFWPVGATADEVYKLLKASPVGPWVAAVTLGSRGNLHLFRWRISLVRDPAQGGDDWTIAGSSFDPAIGIVRVQNLPYVGTGRRIPVYSVIPTGTPTPLRVGSQCGVRLFDGVGWGVTEAELRKLGYGVGYDAPGGYDG